MTLNMFFMAINVVQSVLLIVMFGILASKFFDEKAGNKLDIFLFILIVTFWSMFFGIGIFGIFFGGLSEFVKWISFDSLILSIIVFMVSTGRNIKWVNKKLASFELILFILVFLVVGVDRYNYGSGIVEVILTLTFFVVVLGYFIIIDFFIKGSGEYYKKNKRKS